MAPSLRARLAAACPIPTGHGDAELRLYQVGDEEIPVLRFNRGSSRRLPLVRLHSACATSEIFASIKCDCRVQLDAALARMGREGGLLVYLPQEGRGIGLANKLRAYALQAAGLDTVDANRKLGLPDDARSYDAAGAVLHAVGVTELRLLTNNPDKIEALRVAGFHVVREPHVVDAGPLARAYLRTKQVRCGHEIAPELDDAEVA